MTGCLAAGVWTVRGKVSSFADREVQQEIGPPVAVILFALKLEWFLEPRGAAQATPRRLKNASCTLYLLPNSEAESHDPEEGH